MSSRRDKGRRLLVLGWHNVDGTWGFPAPPGAGRRGLIAQLKALSRFASVVPLGWALERLRGGGGLPPRAVAITFDDGYADNLTLAAPLLSRLRLPATFFLVPAFLSGTTRPWWEDLACSVATATHSTLEWEGAVYSLLDARARSLTNAALAKRLQFRSSAARQLGMEELVERLRPARSSTDLMMGWDGARELVQQGFAVQSHTMAHAVLAQETAQEQRRDLRTAREELERGLDVEVTTVAYPHGTPAHYNAETVDAARLAGYRWGVTTREGLSRRDTPDLEIRRCVMFPERGIPELLAQLRYVVRSERYTTHPRA